MEQETPINPEEGFSFDSSLSGHRKLEAWSGSQGQEHEPTSDLGGWSATGIRSDSTQEDPKGGPWAGSVLGHRRFLGLATSTNSAIGAKSFLYSKFNLLLQLMKRRFLEVLSGNRRE